MLEHDKCKLERRAEESLCSPYMLEELEVYRNKFLDQNMCGHPQDFLPRAKLIRISRPSNSCTFWNKVELTSQLYLVDLQSSRLIYGDIVKSLFKVWECWRRGLNKQEKEYHSVESFHGVIHLLLGGVAHETITPGSTGVSVVKNTSSHHVSMFLEHLRQALRCH